MGPLTHADTLTQTGIPHLSPSVKSANTQTMKKPQALTWENSLNPSRCCSSFSATQVDSLTPVQEAVVAVFSSPNAELPGCYSVPWLLCPLGLCVCVFPSVCAWMARKHPQEWQPAPLLMSAEWTNPHTTLLAWKQAAVMVLFSFCRRSVLSFSVFFFILVPAKPTEELAITSVVGTFLPAFQYTHRRTFVHSSAYIFAQSLPFFAPQRKQTENRYTAHRLSYRPTSRQGDF